jgi:signal peptidase II
MTPSRKFRFIAISLVLICTAGCDQATKHLARAEFSQADFSSLRIRFLQFTLAENPGAFLSLGDSLPQSARTALIFGVAVGLAWMLAHLLRTPTLRYGSLFGLALTWAGGMSNLVDRVIRHGLVTDFMVVRVGPLHTGIFNLADLAIVVGILIVVFSFCAGPQSGELRRR